MRFIARVCQTTICRLHIAVKIIISLHIWIMLSIVNGASDEWSELQFIGLCKLTTELGELCQMDEFVCMIMGVGFEKDIWC